MIVDCHAHIEGLPGCSWQDPPELMIRLMDEAGIQRAIVMTYVDAPGDYGAYDPIAYVADSVAKYPERLWGMARLDPSQGQKARDLLVRSIGELGFKGLKLHPFGYRLPPDGPETVALVNVAAELHAPVLLHCGDEDYTRPLELARLARACPAATLIFGHMGGYFHVHDAIRVAREFPNVVLDTSGMPYPDAIGLAVKELGPEKVLFASDGPGSDPKVELFKVERSGVTGKALERILSENILELVSRIQAPRVGGEGGRA